MNTISRFALFIGIACLGAALIIFTQSTKPGAQKESPLWTKDDEKIFTLLSTNSPNLLKSYVTILSDSASYEKRILGIDYLAYDPIYAEATEVFGENFRVNILIKAIEDQNEAVSKYATSVASNSLTYPEVGATKRSIEKLLEKPSLALEKRELLLKAVSILEERIKRNEASTNSN